MDPFVLPGDQFVVVKVVDIVEGGLRLQFEHEPTHVSPEKALGDIVGVFIGIHMFVVLAVLGAPPNGRVFKCSCSKEKYIKFNWPFCLKCFVGKQSMVSHGDAHTSGDVKKEKNSEKEPIPPVGPKVIRNRSYSKYGSKDEKSTRHPFHPIEWYIFEHVNIAYGKENKRRIIKS
jgi:hypothetical protein